MNAGASVSKSGRLVWFVGLFVAIAIGISYRSWWPSFSRSVASVLSSTSLVSNAQTNVSSSYENEDSDHADHEDHDHAEHDHSAHDHEDGHDHSTASGPADSIELSPQAKLNLGLTAEFLRPLELSTFKRTINVPGVVIPKPGRTEIRVASPLNGVVTHVHSVTGEAVLPGSLLFEIRLSYEDLVESQTAFLKSLGELEVEIREIARLEAVAQSGAVSGKTLLDRRYAKDKLEALIRSQREGLKLHGLSDRQVDAIANEGKLLRELHIVVPDIDQHSDAEELRLSGHPFRTIAFQENVQNLDKQPTDLRPLVIESLQISKGQAVNAGDPLCTLADFSQLFIEGQAFEQDGAAIGVAVAKGWTVDAIFPGTADDIVRDLKLVFVGNAVDRSSRTLSFFVDLSNSVLSDETNEHKQRFISWKYRPGQRLEIQVPVEEWKDQLVVPVDAVVKDGADWFVFQQNGKQFKRVPVHLRYRDQRSAVIANDGSIFPGDVIALRAAHQIQMAIKNLSGPAVDPHAGHSH
jgi:membrane fusion protein, heavy metal efflux system